MAAAEGDGAVGELELQAAIGFNGHVPCGLICHPDKEHILYPLGCTVVIQHLDTQKQSFLHGHTNNVSCVVVSRDGTYVASGQVTCIGFKADIILWDFPKQELLARLSMHEGKVEGLSFSPRGIYLVSLGGQDDSRVMVWDVSKREAVCGSPASPRSAGSANVVVCSSCRDEMFVTAGNFTIRVWELDRATKKIHPSECYAGQLKRITVCVQMTDDDDDFYLGTTSGDVLKVNTSSKVVTACGPQKKKFSMGVTALLLLKTGGLIVGTGEGTVALCTGSDFQVKKRMRVEGGVTSLTCRGQDDQFFIGTNKCQMYRSAYATFKEELVAVCHTEAVNDVVFPAGHSDLFVTCSTNDIRVWYTPERWERLRITVPNVTCQAVEVTRDGMVILSAWNDGKIRAFVPATGEPMNEINNAHSLGVTAIAATSDCKQIISGGGDRQVRIWNIGEKTQKLREVLKEHRGAVSCVKINKNDKEGVTASLDGTCVIWDLVFTIRMWDLDRATKKIHPSECYAGQLKRITVCVQMTDDDDDFYLGTTSGDVLKVNTSSKVVTACGPQKKKFSMGVTALLLLKTGGLIVGTGEGTVALCTGSDFQVKKRMRVEGGVTSLTCRGRDDQFYIGTNKCQMYRSAYATFKEELVAVCHSEAVNDVVFPAGHSDLFVTCSTNDIRVWYTPEPWERLRITVPNVTCQAVEVTRDGMVILSAWNDGKIRAFVPATGEPMYEINNAHNLGVTAIAVTSDCKQIISGGGDGQVRIWNIGEKTQKLREVLKEHRGAVSCIKINKNDKEGVTASLDGTCVIWDLVRYIRKQMILDNTLFKCVCYHPGEYQIITSGTDRKIVYWEVLDGSAVREVQGSLSSSINGMDITSDGASFVTGGDDHLVKLWDYQEGAVTHVGVGHSGSITRLKICPANKFIVSVSADGAVLTWKYPGSG